LDHPKNIESNRSILETVIFVNFKIHNWRHDLSRLIIYVSLIFVIIVVKEMLLDGWWRLGVHKVYKVLFKGIGPGD
jgi:hypothetical protein